MNVEKVKEDRIITLRELVAKKQIFAPCIWDVMSHTAAARCGFEATLLSGGALSGNICGMPDIGLMTADDLVRQTEYIAEASVTPTIVDADDGYGTSPLHAYRTTRRLARAGAMALTLDDTTGYRGYHRWGMKFRAGAPDGTIDHPVVPMKEFLAKTKASLDACEGTDCMLIARTEAKLKYGLDEAIERCLRARELGAEMTLIIGLMNQEEAEKVAKFDKGWKMWPDVMTKNGVPDVNLDDIEPLGFNLVTAHFIAMGAMRGMMDVGKRTLQDRNLVYVDSLSGGFPYGKEAMEKRQKMMAESRRDPTRDRLHWLDREDYYNDID